VFDRADRGGAVLLFDEADALFGQRAEVEDAHDRYANVEVSYLLTRHELDSLRRPSRRAPGRWFRRPPFGA
jgi:hypothetical protein